MVESTAREALKQSMKAWIVTRDRAQTLVELFRENLDDLVTEARDEYMMESRGQADAASLRESEPRKTRPKAAVARSARPSTTPAKRSTAPVARKAPKAGPAKSTRRTQAHPV